MKYIISDSSITRINEAESTIQIATEGAKIEISDSADFTDVFILSSLTPKATTAPLSGGNVTVTSASNFSTLSASSAKVLRNTGNFGCISVSSGSMAGAALGSVFLGIGNMVGGLIGGILGQYGGGKDTIYGYASNELITLQSGYSLTNAALSSSAMFVTVSSGGENINNAITIYNTKDKPVRINNAYYLNGVET